MNSAKRILISLLGLVLLAGLSSAQDVSKLKYPKLNELVMPEVTQVQLDNGMRLYLVEDNKLPVFNMSVRINAGSYLEPAEKVGLAGLAGEVLRSGGTKKWSGDEIDAALEAVGASVETSIGLLSGSASVNALSENTDLVLDILTDVLRNPVFDKDKLELAKVQYRSAISRRNDDPQQIGQREFAKLIYGANSVYARQEEYATVNSVTRDDLVAFHQTWFKPENVQMALWGNFKKEELVEKIKARFGDWAKGSTPVPPPPQVDYAFESGVYYVNKDDVTQSNIYIGHIGGLVKDEDYAARIVMNNILGGSFSSRLFNTVRSKEGLAYGTFGTYSANIAYPGTFFVYAGTKSNTTGKAVKVLMSEIKRMQTEPPTDYEMKIGREAELNSFVFNFDTKAEVVNRLMNYDFYGMPADFLQQTQRKIESTTPTDVINAAKKNLRPDAVKVLVVGKGADFEMPLDQLGLGAVQTIDITIPAAEEKKALAMTPENLTKGTNLLAKAAKAHGGVANFQKIKSVLMKGTYTLSTPQGEFPIQVESVEQLPDKSRQVSTVFGQKMMSIRNGTAGWQTARDGQIKPMTEEEVIDDDKDRMRNLIRIFRQVDKPDFQAVYDGAGEVDGKSVEQVVIASPDGENICTLSLDPTTSQVVAKSYWGQTPLGEGQIVEIYSKTGAYAGVKLPTGSVLNKDGQKMATLEFSEIVINGPVQAEAFDQP